MPDTTPASRQLVNFTKAMLDDANAEIKELRTALQNLHDWYVQYARVNCLFDDDGSPATFHELLEARRILAK